MNGRNVLAAGLVVALGGGALAQFKPEGAYRESPAVAERYPDPQIAFTTPAFAPGKTDFTSQAEMMRFLTELAARAPKMTLSIVAKSQEGRDMPALVFSRHGLDTIGKGQRPVVMLIGQQHGNEPAGGEAMLVLAERLGAGTLAPLLDAIDVVIIPRGNPDGADRFRRALANGIDANRDHTQLRTPEIRAIAELFTRYRPDIVLDCHEFTVAGRWVEKTGGMVKIDGMIQAATVPNLAPALKQVQDEVVLPALRSAFEAAGVSYDWYHTTDGANPASPVAMGSIGADTGRNIAGLRNAVSLLLETRGVGIGRAHLGRRVQAHVVASEAIMKLAAQRPGDILAATRKAEAEVTAIKPGTPFVVTARQRPEQRLLTFIDPVTGQDRQVEVTWLSSLDIEATMMRSRPAGYVLPAKAAAAIEALQRLGLTTETVANAARVPGERYRVVKVELGAKEDGRGDDTGAGQIVKGSYVVEPASVQLEPGDVYIGLDQPLAALLPVMLEPESQTGLAANKVLPVSEGGVLDVLRITERPGAALAKP
ncbi:MAG TPA: M14 family metallopeptidase [Bosea sp. (in: a-proteobacteria)]|jgi:predicted deacylase|uniref:M14 family metallopeptidase n=1 Tax=Bosea sp. (in: a-proteobacteria) TaxID=1871050 RepID=UPI002E13C22C|nr:M14 family metallopeptidase [Bosea sp. (in: a-proteobacteria)]